MYPPNPILRRYYKKEFLSSSSVDYTINIRLFIDNGFRVTIHSIVQPHINTHSTFTVKIARPDKETPQKIKGVWTHRYIVTKTYREKDFKELEEIIWRVINFNRKNTFEIDHTATRYLFAQWFEPSADWNPWKKLQINSN